MGDPYGWGTPEYEARLDDALRAGGGGNATPSSGGNLADAAGPSTPMGFGSDNPYSMIGAGIGATGGVISAAMSAGAARDINDANLAYAREATGINQAFARETMDRQEKFQQTMANSAYQRATADMKAAGINPMLAVQNGGAATPSGSSVSASAAPYKGEIVDKGEIVRRGLSTALDAARFEKDQQAADANIKLTKTADAVKQTEKNLNEVSAEKIQKEADNQVTKNAMNNLEYATQLRESGARVAEADKRKKQAEWDSKWIDYDNTARRVREATGIIKNATSAFTPFGKALSAEEAGMTQDELNEWVRQNQNRGR